MNISEIATLIGSLLPFVLAPFIYLFKRSISLNKKTLELSKDVALIQKDVLNLEAKYEHIFAENDALNDYTREEIRKIENDFRDRIEDYVKRNEFDKDVTRLEGDVKMIRQEMYDRKTKKS